MEEKPNNSVSLLTYNIFFNKAVGTISQILEDLSPDVLCLQEVETTQENLTKFDIHGYKLADFSNSFIKFSKVFGLVTFYNPQKLRLISSYSFDIPRSFIEMLVTIFRGFNNPRTVLKTQFLHLPSQKKITIYNVHFTHLIASNRTRMRQLKETLSDLDISHNESVIVSGDFNYTYGRKGFEEVIHSYGFKEATNNLTFTARGVHHMIFLKLKSDYILYKNLILKLTRKIDYTKSDHFPIYSQFYI